LILNNSKSKLPARIKRWNLRLQEYDFTAVHTKGEDNPSDFLSRHPSQDTSRRDEKRAEEYVNFISSHAVPKAMALEDIQQATTADATLQKLAELIRTNNWTLMSNEPTATNVNVTELKLFAKVREELTVNDDSNIILRGTRIVMPLALRQQAMAIAHEGHQGLVKTKQLLREKTWFPQIDEDVRSLIGNCLACQANGPASHPDPLQMSPLPPEPWHTVHMDFCGPFPTGEYLLVVIDAYSRFPEVDVVNSTSASSTIGKLERIFSTHGIPRVAKSDNGPPFTSDEFRSFMDEKGVKHQRITPLWPQANSEAENFMKPLTKSIRSSHANGRNWKKDLHTFLLNYRATPHTTTGFAPSKLLFNRLVKTKLPQVATVSESEVDTAVRMKDQHAKAKMKEYADTKRKAKPHSIQIGDMVLLRQKKQNEFSMTYRFALLV
jgi:transposase InsO family protein